MDFEKYVSPHDNYRRVKLMEANAFLLQMKIRFMGGRVYKKVLSILIY